MFSSVLSYVSQRFSILSYHGDVCVSAPFYLYYTYKQRRKRPLDTPKRMIERRQREGEIRGRGERRAE